MDIAAHSEYATKSRNYKLGMAHGNMEASIEGSMIFDPSSQLPREALLETTLKAFGYSMDIWEVGSPISNPTKPHNSTALRLPPTWLSANSANFVSKCLSYCRFLQQVGMQGKGFEPTVEALFGKNGFFPDTLSKTLYWTIDKLPGQGTWHRMGEGVRVFDFFFFFFKKRYVYRNFISVESSTPNTALISFSGA